MLNNDDIKQIGSLLDEKLEQKLGEKLEPIHKQLEKHGKMLEEHGKLLNSHGKLLRSLKKDQDIMLNMLDKEQMDQRKRLKKVEEQIGLSSSL